MKPSTVNIVSATFWAILGLVAMYYNQPTMLLCGFMAGSRTTMAIICLKEEKSQE